LSKKGPMTTISAKRGGMRKKMWDCCAGVGKKEVLKEMTVTDTRGRDTPRKKKIEKENKNKAGSYKSKKTTARLKSP